MFIVFFSTLTAIVFFALILGIRGGLHKHDHNNAHHCECKKDNDCSNCNPLSNV